MKTGPMANDFVFTEESLDGTRLIRLVMPEAIAASTVASVAATYLALWDDERPTVGLGDISHLRELSPEMLEIFTVFARRVTVLPNYVGSAWFTGANHPIAVHFRTLANAAGRDPNSIVETEAEAIAYLRGRIASHRAAEE
jgi:hypothetical protein